MSRYRNQAHTSSLGMNFLQAEPKPECFKFIKLEATQAY